MADPRPVWQRWCYFQEFHSGCSSTFSCREPSSTSGLRFWLSGSLAVRMNRGEAGGLYPEYKDKLPFFFILSNIYSIWFLISPPNIQLELFLLRDAGLYRSYSDTYTSHGQHVLQKTENVLMWVWTYSRRLSMCNNSKICNICTDFQNKGTRRSSSGLEHHHLGWNKQLVI